jgi:hypothetical protein
MGRRPEYVHRRSDGKLIRTREHIKPPHGGYDRTKSKALMVLYTAWQKKDPPDGLSVLELSNLACVSYLSLKTLLPRWARINYVRRGAKLFHNKAVLSYFLAIPRGQAFVEKRIPPGVREQYRQEILETRRLKATFQRTQMPDNPNQGGGDGPASSTRQDSK